MISRNVAIGAGVLALAGFGACAPSLTPPGL
jgi:hypothetical protein